MVKKKAKQASSEVKKPKTTVRVTKSEAKLLPKLSLFFFDRPRFTAILMLAVFLFGAASYTTLLKREGFPSISIPVASINGTYFVNDPAKVDADVTKPITEVALKQEGAQTVSSQSFGNFFNIFVQYKEGTDAQAEANKLEEAIKSQNILPANAGVVFTVPVFGATGASTKQIDLGISFTDQKGGKTTEQLTIEAQKFADDLKAKNLSLVKDVFILNPFEKATNPFTGQEQTVQKSFDRFGERVNDTNNFYNSVFVAVTKTDGADVIKLDDQVRAATSEIIAGESYAGYGANISASYASAIKDNIGELQKVLLEGLIVVLLVGSIVIAVRASIVTVLSMITVLSATLGVLFLLGYTLNVITLFAIILSLSLIVDDTIIMVEAIDAQRRRQKNARDAVEVATRRVSGAMIAATSTAALSFAPLIFVGGVLGSFIRAIPITIISALLISLFVALVFIPLLARFLLLGKNQMGEEGVKEMAAGIESKIAEFIAKPMRWGHDSRKRLVFVGLTAVFIGFSFIAASAFIGRNVIFNIFPPSKDANDIQVALTFNPGTDIKAAQIIADQSDALVGEQLGVNFNEATYYGVANERDASLQVSLISYNERDVRAPELVKQLQDAFDESGLPVKAAVAQIDAGPPASAFAVRIESDKRAESFVLAADIAKFLDGKELVRPSGEKAVVENVTVGSSDVFARTDGKLGVTVTAGFDGTDTTTLVNLTKTAMEAEFTPEKVASYGLEKDALVYDFGQESENQDSFATLAIAFPALLFVIYLLLTIQFKSLLQPLLIFMAIPFSLFGITLGLYLTNNPFSFFAMLGFFALIGLSIKNTILLTDYANQARRAGMSGVDAAIEALRERFRPLIATSLTAVVSLIPLALQSPFWEGLAVVLICGLLSSTFLVVVVFPYYYLGAEFLRVHVSTKIGFLWSVGLIAATAAAIATVPKFAGIVLFAYVALGVALLIRATSKKRA